MKSCNHALHKPLLWTPVKVEFQINMADISNFFSLNGRMSFTRVDAGNQDIAFLDATCTTFIHELLLDHITSINPHLNVVH